MPLTMSDERETEIRGMATEYGVNGLLAEIDALRLELQKAKDALKIEQRRVGSIFMEREDLKEQLAQSAKTISGMRENADDIAVKLGVDCEKMDDAATWHASAAAIEGYKRSVALLTAQAAGQCEREEREYQRGVAQSAETQDEAIDVAWKRARAFIADELECRESSMMPPSDDDAHYIASAKAALRAIDQIGVAQSREVASKLAKALRSIKEECYTNLDCNHQEQDSKIDPGECENIDDCIGCTLTQIADDALALYAAHQGKGTETGEGQ